MFNELLQKTLAAVPSQCAVCHAWPRQPVCESCVVRFAQPEPRCRTCALAVHGGAVQCGACVARTPVLDACHAAVDYAYPWAGCVASFKFNDDPGWASALATLMRSAPWVEPELEQADLVLPMPLSRERLRERGFNQALLLAHQLAPRKTDATLLLRIRHTPAQNTLSRSARLANLRGAFAVAPLRAQRLQGARVVLVDDVMTSGASLHAAAAVLRAGGAARVGAVVFARTPDAD